MTAKNEEMLYIIKWARLFYDTNKSLSQKDFKVEYGAPCSFTRIKSLFGSWYSFLDKAGLPTNKVQLSKLKYNELKKELLKRKKETETNCWIYPTSYIYFRNKKEHPRVVYSYAWGDRLKNDPTCKNNNCVNPMHTSMVKKGTK